GVPDPGAAPLDLREPGLRAAGGQVHRAQAAAVLGPLPAGDRQRPVPDLRRHLGDQRGRLRDREVADMRALRLLPLLALTGLVLLAAPAAAAAQAGEEAKIIDFDFSPGRLTVEAGTTVTWTNTGSRPHTATDRGGTFDTRPIAPGAKGQVTLSTPGTYFYFCRINPAKMNGARPADPGPDEPRAVRVQAVDPGFTGDRLRFDPPELTVAAGTTLLVANVGGKPHTLTT